MKEPAQSVAQRMDCPKCHGVAMLAVPNAMAAAAYAIYGCGACGFAFKADGTPYVDNVQELRDYFRGATLGHKTLADGLKGVDLPPAAKVLFQAQIIEYGTNMWFDGLKQGLLLGAIQATKEAKSGEV